ncbi:MAG: exosortase system-associated protein, TIGR04073 family [Candidatus Omnitrophica bacterium]|nr:exosortase system-associated protein, TIGR04073 family [Candidatus Omnitrophota bacterium]
MKKVLVLLVVCSLLLQPAAHAGNLFIKLARGVADVAVSPQELAKGIMRTTEERGPLVGFSFGTVKGLCNMLGRMAVGVYEIATFPVPIPADYGPVWNDPEGANF